MNYRVYFFLCFILGAIMEYIFHLPPIFMIFILATVFFIILKMEANKITVLNAQENHKLQSQMQISSKNVHLKFKQLSIIINSIPYPILLVDEVGKIVLYNHIEELSTDFKEKEFTYLYNSFYLNVHNFVKKAFICEEKMEEMLSVNEKVFKVISNPILSANKFNGCFIFFYDMTEAIIEEKKQKRFLADASHELKTPICSMKGMLEILNRDDFDDENIKKEFLNQMELEVDRLNELVKDLLLLSKLSSDQFTFHPKWINVETLFASCIKSLYSRAKKKNLTINTLIQSHEALWADEMKIQQVILNLLENAIKYSDQGVIELIYDCNESHYILSVHDQGPGLTKEQCFRIFDRFYRIDDDRSRKNGGSGLGLAIVKSIVENHNGVVQVDSEVNVGSKFVVKLNRCVNKS